MDKDTEKRLDAIVEDELHKGYRIKEVPATLQHQLESERGQAIRRVRFTRLNMFKRRKIAEYSQRQYHKDIQDPQVLSRAQILKLVAERGEWNDEKEKEMRELQVSVNRRMSVLYFSMDAQGVLHELTEASALFQAEGATKVKAEDLELFNKLYDRWLNYTPDQQEQYNELFAKPDGKQRYSADSDFQRLVALAPWASAADELTRIEGLRDRVYNLLQLRSDRQKLNDLLTKHARIFADSAEQRQEVAEELARMYYTTEVVDETGAPKGPLAPKVEELENFPEEFIQWVQVENFFFLNGVPDAAREYLEAVGFHQAERPETTETASSTSESEASAASPVPPISKVDFEAAVTTDDSSSGRMTDTE